MIVCCFRLCFSPHSLSFSQFGDSAARTDTSLFRFKLVYYIEGRFPEQLLGDKELGIFTHCRTKPTVKNQNPHQGRGGRRAKIKFVLSVMYV